MVILLFSLFGLKSINLGGPKSILLKFFIFFLASVIDFRCFLFFVLFLVGKRYGAHSRLERDKRQSHSFLGINTWQHSRFRNYIFLFL